MNFILVVVIFGCVGINNSMCQVTPYSINFTFKDLSECERVAASIQTPFGYGVYIHKFCAVEK
jgi:hypothetical protein